MCMAPGYIYNNDADQGDQAVRVRVETDITDDAQVRSMGVSTCLVCVRHMAPWVALHIWHVRAAGPHCGLVHRATAHTQPTNPRPPPPNPATWLPTPACGAQVFNAANSADVISIADVTSLAAVQGLLANRDDAGSLLTNTERTIAVTLPLRLR